MILARVVSLGHRFGPLYRQPSFYTTAQTDTGVFYKWDVCGNHAWDKPIGGAVLLTAFARFVSLCHFLAISPNVSNFFIATLCVKVVCSQSFLMLLLHILF